MHDIILHLSLIRAVGPVAINKIITSFKGDDIYRCSVSDIAHLAKLSMRVAQLVHTGLSSKKELDQERYLIEKSGVSIVTLLDEHYPVLLKNIYAPPPLLYYQGTLNHKLYTIACVGSRNADFYGQAIVKKIIPELVASDWHVVSGGALGIDTYAHVAVLEAGGTTTVVLGSGLLRPYPLNNQKLFEKIIASGGAVMSPFSLQTGPLAGNFPARNRIIAGLAQVCLVVQAAQKSGSLITAQFALEQGREVAVVPGSILSDVSLGCHRMIQQGAALVVSAEDIMNLVDGNSGEHCYSTTSNLKESLEPLHNTLVKQEETRNKGILSLEKQIVELCRYQVISTQELVNRTGAVLSEVHDILFDLQVEGLLYEPAPGLWRCCP